MVGGGWWWWLVVVAARLGGGSEMGNQEGRRRSRWSGCVVIYAGQATGDRRQASIKSKQQERALNSEQSNGSEGQLGAIGSTGSTRTSPRKPPIPPPSIPYPSIPYLSNPYHPHPSSSLIPSTLTHPILPINQEQIRAGEKGEDGPSIARTHGTPNTEPAYVPFRRGTIERTESRQASVACLSPALPRTKRRLS